MGACWGGTLLLLSLLTLSLPLHPRCALPSDKNSAAAARHLLARGVCVQVAPHVLDLHLQVTHGAGLRQQGHESRMGTSVMMTASSSRWLLRAPLNQRCPAVDCCAAVTSWRAPWCP
jgi:hypothetical protein